MAPIHGASVPRAELQAMVMLVRTITTVLRAAAFSCNRVSLVTDSACFIAAINRSGATLHPYLANRVAEITHCLSELRQEFGGVIKSFSHIEGKLNPADMGTRPGIRLSNLGPGSKWQAGPEFLKLPRNRWPLKAKVSAKAPKEEIRKRPLELRGFAVIMKGRVREVNKDLMKPLSLLGTARRVLETATLWSKAQGTVGKNRGK